MSGRSGRKPLDPDDHTVPVTVRLPSRQADELYERASRERTSVPEIIRRSLEETQKKDS